MSEMVAEDPRYEALYERLLGLGGSAVVSIKEEDLEKILARGYARSGRGIGMRTGGRSACHRNAALLWDANRDRAVIVVGWALSEDGLWRQHSWVKDTVQDRLYETTEKRKLYFGFDLTPEESETFYFNNAY